MRGAEVAIADGEAPPAAVAAARRLLDGATGGGDPELLTLIVGAEASEGEPDVIRRALEEAFPDLTVDVLAGDQPGVRYLLGME